MVSFRRFKKRRGKSNKGSSSSSISTKSANGGSLQLGKVLAKRFTRRQSFWRALETSSDGESIPAPKPAPNSKSDPFDKLAPETIQAIAEFLPLASKACFCLCSHALARMIGTEFWRTVRSQPEDRLELCELLGRDLPEHVFCSHCKIIHRPSKLDGRCNQDVVNEGHLQIRFLDFQLAMQRHHLELPMASFMDGLAKTSTKPRKGYMYQCTTEARIVSESLLIRSQQWYMIPPDSAAEFPQDKMASVCSHLVHDPSRPSCSPDRLKALLRCRLRYNPNSKICRLVDCTGIKKCFHCNTEIQIHMKDFQGQGTAVIITAWRDFGEGRSPRDSNWRDQTALGFELFDVDKKPKKRRCRVNFEAGSIKARFEDGKEFVFDSYLTEENKMALLSGRPKPLI